MQRSYRSTFPYPLDALRGRCRLGVISPRALFGATLAAVAVVSIGAAWWWAGRRESLQDTPFTDLVVKAPKPPLPSNLDDFRPRTAATIRRVWVKVRANPDDAAAWCEMAVLYDAHHLFELAEQVYERAVQLDASVARCWYGLAYVRGELGDLEACIPVSAPWPWPAASTSFSSRTSTSASPRATCWPPTVTASSATLAPTATPAARAWGSQC